jgi:hypothetical protein
MGSSSIHMFNIYIPPGIVEMRDDRTKKIWSVDIGAFKLSKYPVTQELYTIQTGENPSSFNGGKLLVESLSWIDAVTFCNNLSESLGQNKCYSIDLKTQKVNFGPGSMWTFGEHRGPLTGTSQKLVDLVHSG